MPVRATKRGAERSPLPARPTSSSAVRLRRAGGRTRARRGRAPTCSCSTATRSASARRPRARRRRRGSRDSACRPRSCQTFADLVIHTPLRTLRWDLPWTFSTFDYRELCALLWAAAATARFETATVSGRSRATTARSSSTPIAATCRRRSSSTRSAGGGCCRRRRARSSRRRRRSRAGSRSTRAAPASDFELWLDPRYVREGYSGLPGPRRGARRRRLVRPARPRRASRRCGSRATSAPARRLPGQLDPAPAARGDRGRRVLRRRQRRPLHPADGRGHPPRVLLRPVCGRELRARDRGPADARAGARALRLALARRSATPTASMLRAQRFVGRATPYPLMTSVLEAAGHPRFGPPGVRALRRHLPAAEPRRPRRRRRALAHDQVDADREQRDADELRRP